MLLTDALSRCPSQASGEIKLDMRVNYIAFSKTWIAKLKDTMREDPILGTECLPTSVLTRAGCRHPRLHKEVPRMYTLVSSSQRATASSQCATTALGKDCNGLFLHEWQVVYSYL